MTNIESNKNFTVKVKLKDIELLDYTIADSYSNIEYDNYNKEVTGNILKPEENYLPVIITFQYTLGDAVKFLYKTKNIFDIQNLQDLYNDGLLENDDFNKELIKMSIYHSRGYQAAINHERKIDVHIIPFVSPSKIFVK